MKTFVILFASILLTACNAQEKNKNRNTTEKTREMTTEKFDIVSFNKHQVNGEYNFVLKDGSKVRQLSSDNYYEEIITLPKPSYFETYKKYYKTSELYLSITSFPNDFLVLKKEYDKTGKLIEEINFDLPYEFTFEQLLELMKKEKDTIDLFDKNTSIGRSSDTTGTFWYITYKKTPMRRERIKINGITGEILERSHYPHEDN
ncbi:hypothetical protein [Tenacibaculum sp. SDUM215027]|uniref:hypothetical protein n=1 Tax=Tenacibaculum sp. SDUM215027 TaxID=3422596 RepID=UPI003D320F6D